MLNESVNFDFSIMKKLLDVAHGKLINIKDRHGVLDMLMDVVAPRPATSGRATPPEATHTEDESASVINSIQKMNWKNENIWKKQQYDDIYLYT